MFTLKLTESRILSNSIAVISDFITEATFSLTKAGMKLIAMDPANISMVVLEILPSAFTEFSVPKSEEVTINLDSLSQALKRVKPTDTITLTQEKNRLKITISGKSTKTFSIPLLEKEGKDRQVPELEFNATIDLDAKEFRDYIDDASIVGDAITLEADKEKLTLHAGETGRKVNIELKKGSDALINLKVKEDVLSIYSIEYLKKMARSATLADTATLRFSKDYPLRLDFKAVDKLQMSFILAPRIENK